MGTRGLLGFIIAAQRHAAFNRYDSYPSNLGTRVVEFILGLNGPEDYAEMAHLVRRITWVDEKSTPSPELQRKYSEMGFCETEEGFKDPTNWFCLLYKLQGGAALPAIQSGNLEHLVESVDFLKDGIFCEWAYFIDFENQILETWTCGQHVADVSFQDLTEYGARYMEFLTSLTKLKYLATISLKAEDSIFYYNGDWSGWHAFPMPQILAELTAQVGQPHKEKRHHIVYIERRPRPDLGYQ
ncbi:hypothetical protein NLJ89_g6562 [Agrocybe chaxingu]|uniref:Uncharacterized protein n=1 Tax=Agrocybe chaxingu TaxID=84603 RepID=A0A9W8MUI3_9AGAR|nr:hypothetical protein NLJ89_g6562 [Agrocybe chaxingu]